MANGLTENLTLNPKEVQAMSEFIQEKVYTRADLRALHNVMTGVKMKQQIGFASQFGKTGLKGDATCTRKTSGAKSTLSEKYWEPKGIEDTLVHCQKEIDPLLKAYTEKILSYKQRYEIEGSDLQIFFSILLIESMIRTIYRAIWFGDTAVAAADSDSAGLVSAGNVQFYDYFDGLWKQIFSGVTGGTIKRYTIALNSQLTPALQLTFTAGLARTYFEGVWALADPRLKADPTAKFYVSNGIFENYRQDLQNKGENSTIQYTIEGFQTLKWNGKDIVNMETIWDLDLFADFVAETTHNQYYLPNRVVLTTPENIPIATMNEADLGELEIWYEKKDRTNNMAYGFDLDAKVLEGYMICVGY